MDGEPTGTELWEFKVGAVAKSGAPVGLPVLDEDLRGRVV
jgi:hypothetical protein